MPDLPVPLRPTLAKEATEVAERLLGQAASSDDLAVPSAAVELWQRIIIATPAGDANRPLMLSNLGMVLQLRSERTGEEADLDAAITALEAAVEAAPADHPARPVMLSNLGRVLQLRSERTGERADLSVRP